MLYHSIKLIYRNFIRFKSTFLINLIGLSTGLVCTLLIYLWINDELSFDKFHERRIFQVMENQTSSTGIITQEAMPSGMAYVLSEIIPEVEYAATVTPMAWFPKFTIEHEGTRIKNEGKFVGKDFFNIFSFELAYGNKEDIFKDINAIVISEALATKLFGSIANASGKTIAWEVAGIKKESVVSGIFHKLPANSSEQFDLLLNIDLLAQIMNFAKDDLMATGPSTFLTLKPGTDIKSFNDKVSRFMTDRTGKKQSEYFVVQYTSKYLYGKFENGVQTGSRMEYVKLFGVIGIIILLIACINFMNLSTAKASRRIKEVGIKKALGAWRKTLVAQYLGESVFISFLSLGIAILLVTILLPSFNEITGKQLELNFSIRTICAFLVITLATGIVAGSYPALYLSGFNPAIVLKGKLNTSIGELFARKGLVIFQFAVSIIFIVSVVVIYQQMSFVQNRNLGYDKDNILYFEIEGKVAENHNAFLDAARAIPGVKNVSAMVGNIASSFGNSFYVDFEDRKIPFHDLMVDYGMIETLGIPMKEGRAFAPSFNDIDRIVLNSAAVDKMGIKDPIGKQIDFGGKKVEIIGVTENFHHRSLHEEIAPLAFILETRQLLNIFIKIEQGREEETIQSLQTLYKQFNPGFAFDYTFLDHAYQSQYAAEKRVASLSFWFAILTIMVSCLGLFGLAAFTAERRVKEIGIRKVLGATPAAIMYLLSIDFLKLVFISILIALPISYYLTGEWLQNFAYAINLEIWFFVGAGILAILIALMTVGSQAIKASLVNPTECLKDE
ncbi:MAG: ABC transporter permease [Chryseolinea sp.]